MPGPWIKTVTHGNARLKSVPMSASADYSICQSSIPTQYIGWESKRSSQPKLGSSSPVCLFSEAALTIGDLMIRVEWFSLLEANNCQCIFRFGGFCLVPRSCDNWLKFPRLEFADRELWVSEVYIGECRHDTCFFAYSDDLPVSFCSFIDY